MQSQPMQFTFWTLAQQTTPAAANSQPVLQASEPVPVGVPAATGAPGQALVPGAPPAGAAPAKSAPTMDFMWIMMVLLVVMVVMTSLAGRKERKKRQEIMSSLKKQDKVITTGGVIGTVVELTDDEAVLRVEEGKIRVTRTAIANVLRQSAAGSEKPAIAGAA